MTTASATAALPNNPDRSADPTADNAATHSHADNAATQPHADRPPRQSRAGRMVSLLRKLIDYGQDLVRSVQQRAAAGTLFIVALHFGTRDAAVILARITRGLLLAKALEARLISRPARLDASPARVRTPPDRAERTARRPARPALPDLPTAEEIAAALRHRPAAAVIGDICRDLGIVPAHPLWGEVMIVLSEHGGGFVKFFLEVINRVCSWLIAPSPINTDGRSTPPSQPSAACGTGPP